MAGGMRTDDPRSGRIPADSRRSQRQDLHVRGSRAADAETYRPGTEEAILIGYARVSTHDQNL